MPRQQKEQDDRLHIPVLVREVLEYLSPQADESYLDLTAGYGGHAHEVLRCTKNVATAVLVDRDESAVKQLQKTFGDQDPKIIHQDYLTASRELVAKGQKFDMILADLGVSSPHLDTPNRGFAFGTSGPLDMRMDIRQDLTAGNLVNDLDPVELANILKRYGQEPRARSIVDKIVQNRPITSTDQLAGVISQATGWRFKKGKIHPATRSFQALRIAVNDELSQLEKSLPLWANLLAPEGRLVIISFHSLEDRLVKRFFADHAGNTYDSELISLTKKPVTPSSHEIVSNPRARSAKLRASRKK